jgi:hypothetical protein
MKTLQLKLRPGSERHAAAIAGSASYFTGTPCRRGHVAERRTSNGMCSACQSEWLAANKDRADIHSRSYKERHRERIRARTNETYKNDRADRPWKITIMFARDRARDKGVEFSLTSAWGLEHWTGVCAITGIPFVLDHGLAHNHPFSPSLDRIDQALGYTPGNCRFVLSAVNTFRGLMTDEQMREVASAIVSGPSAGTNDLAVKPGPKTKVESQVPSLDQPKEKTNADPS